MSDEIILGLIESLVQIEEDGCVPRNVRLKLQNAVAALKEDEKELCIRVNKALQELDDLSDDANIPPYIRPQIWNVVSILESL